MILWSTSSNNCLIHVDVWNPNVQPGVLQTRLRMKTSDNKRRLNLSEVISKLEKMCNPKTKDQAPLANVLFLFTTA